MFAGFCQIFYSSLLHQVHKFSGQLPPSLLRLLISDQVFKIGNSIKADFTRLKKQFSQLEKQKSFNVIDLKEYCTCRGIIPCKGSGGLDILLEKTAGMYLSKDESLRKSDDWEAQEIHPDLLQYAALDVYASRIVFERATEIAPPANVDTDMYNPWNPNCSSSSGRWSTCSIWESCRYTANVFGSCLSQGSNKEPARNRH